VYYYNNEEVVGYLTKADNLNLLVVRNAGHMVPLSQPPYAQQMLEEFTAGSM
jgi:carboxypeptidase C (cathepsin A)